MTELELEDDLAGLPPSAKLVLVILRTNGPQTKAEICDRGQLHQGTVLFALDRLEEHDQITSRHSTDDARQTVYSVSRK